MWSRRNDRLINSPLGVLTCGSRVRSLHPMSETLCHLHITVIAADGLYKRDVFSRPTQSIRLVAGALTSSSTGFPDPFAVATIGGEQTRTTSVIKKTLNPYWNESFDMFDIPA